MQQVDDPPYLTVGTEVSAKYKGAFCEAKVRKVVRNIKCKVAYKQGLGSGTVSDDQIKCDLLRVGATVEVKHPDRRDTVEATITKIQDYSQYTVVFDDGDITTLRRSALCLKSGRHFNESETLDQLPLTHPEHFGNPVIGGRRGRSLELYKKSVVRSRHTPEESSEEDEEPEATKPPIIEKEEHIGKIVCVESTDTKKKGPKENWFPALVVAPTAQDTVRIRVKDEYLVRSFKDGRYYTVPKKEATEFTREQATKQDNAAVQAALEYLHHDCLPAHWDREVLFGLGNSSSDFYNEFDSDTSDDEPTEEKDHFVAQLYKYMDDRGTPLNKGPSIINKDVDLYRLYRAVQKLGGYNRVTSQNQWKQIAIRLGFVPTTNSIQNLVKQAYKKFLWPFEEFDRKLGCSMVPNPRANRIKGRSLVRANSVASPKPEKEAKSTTSAAEESENTSESSIETTTTTTTTATTTTATSKPTKTKATGKVKALVDRYEEKAEESKREQTAKDSKEKDSKEKDSKEKDSKEKDSKEKDSKEKDSKEKESKEKDSKEKEIKEKETKTKDTKSKEKDVSNVKLSDVSPVTPSSRKEKGNKKQPTPQVDEKKGRKKDKKIEVNEKVKLESDDKDKSDQSNVPINVGDKLRVYYHEQKVTYEAKVIEISKQNDTLLYLVHYTGWNTRYDEWVPKERIAENLTNSKTNKRAKTVSAGKNDGRPNSSTSEKLPGPSPVIRSASKRNRSRGDSQPPRSTTPSSIASNSSRTKSPATPAQQRRATRGQPNKRRTSNNTDISSLQTDSDSDSDEPVVKKQTPKRKVAAAKTKVKRESVIEAIEIKKEKDSNLSSDEETLASTVAKSREYELSQRRSELKGFNDNEKPVVESTVTSASTIEKKFDYIPKVEPDTGITTAASTAAANTNATVIATANSIASRTKASSSNSSPSETDSYGDEDSQPSDKVTTTHVDSVSDKSNKFAFDKTPAGKPHEMMATLKQSGIEKIIKTTLAEKPKAPPEKLMMKTLVERTPFKDMEKDTHEKKNAESNATLENDAKLPVVVDERKEEKPKDTKGKLSIPENVEYTNEVIVKEEPEKGAPSKDLPTSVIEQNPNLSKLKSAESSDKRVETTAQAQSKSPQLATSSQEQSSLESKLNAEVTVKIEAVEMPAPKQIYVDKPKQYSKSVIRQSIITSKDEPKSLDSETTPTSVAAAGPTASAPVKVAATAEAAGTTATVATASTAVTAPTCDIYEFKEPELFEFETTKKLSPDADKKTKRRAQGDTTKPSLSSPVAVPLPAKRTKKVAKEAEKIKEDDQKPVAVKPQPVQSTSAFSVNVDSIFDSLHKSPCYMATPDQLDETMMMNEDCPSTSEAIPVQQVASEMKPLFINSFVDATPVDTSKIFDFKSSTSDFKEDLEKDLESVKKIMLSDEVLNQEPPKIDKPSSIADKVLKALHSQQQMPGTSAAATVATGGDNASNDEAAADELETDTTTPLSPSASAIAIETKSKPLEKLSAASTSMTCGEALAGTMAATTSTRASSSYRAGISPTSETSSVKPVLNKIDILESISPKNNDLSETIQKLESAIQKSGEHTHMSEDTSDSTDSEQRLVIEDESQSSETPNEFVLSKQENDQSYGGKQSGKEKAVAVSGTTSISTAVTSAVAEDAAETVPEAVSTPIKAPSSDKKVYGIDEKSKPTDKTTPASEMPLPPEPTLLATDATASPIVDPKLEVTEEPATEQTATAEATTAAESAAAAATTTTTTTAVPVSVKTEECITDKVCKTEDDLATENAQNESISLLLCEETIPGSPAPACPKEQCDIIKKSNYDMFTSPMQVADIDTKPMPIVTSTTATDTKQQKSKNATPRSSPRDSMSQEDSSEENNKKPEPDRTGSTKKRRCTRKQSEAETATKRRKATARRNTNTGNMPVQINSNISGSESEDNSDPINAHKLQRPSKSHQYNFLVQLDPAMNSTQRITILKKKIQDLRKTYNMIKTELASIDRRRKKLRRREREMKKNVQKQLQQQQQQILIQVDENHPSVM